MMKHHQAAAGLALLLTACMPMVGNAQGASNVVGTSNTATTSTPPAPAVAYVGDWLTVGWAPYIPGSALGNCCDDAIPLGNYLSDQITNAIGQKANVIHIMIGSIYANADTNTTFTTQIPAFEKDLSEAIQQVQAAHIRPILGIEPSQLSFNPAVLLQMDSVVYTLGQKYGVQVVNYNGAFAGTAQGFGYGTPLVYSSANPPIIGTAPTMYSPLQPTVSGYNVMTMMAQTAIYTSGASITSLYLQNEEEGNVTDGGNDNLNVNTVSPGVTVQFYPVASYSNGVTGQDLLNCDFSTGSNGSWTSSSPLAGFVNPVGHFWALTTGTTTIKFTAPNGVGHEWIMYIK